ncbi:hypothetical protein SAY86_011467 [Trapa natans]|uniref:Uncharacterized protein n=1 Tax=Trapa natans TaxID=22666 RepID=A0AAN7LN96_TRANT|nr:hypothetical protein SAY86_011467 [Trapa natans]
MVAEAMESEYEISSSSLSFASPNDADTEANPDHRSLSKLSSSLEKLLLGPTFSSYADAEIVVDDVAIGVNRCLLAVRSDYFHSLFSKPCDEQKPRYRMLDLMAMADLPGAYVGLEAFNLVLNYLYTGRLKPAPADVSTCVDGQCLHRACRPAVDYVVQLMYASTAFQIKELVLLLQRRLLYFVENALVEDVIPILVVASTCKSEELLSDCIKRISMSDLDSVTLKKEIPPEVLPQIKQLQHNYGLGVALDSTDNEKRVAKILKALDSDDVELMELLLKESNITLDDAFALHYAAAYSDLKTLMKVLDLKSADLNQKNSRGLTVLHVAARRRDPAILVPLLANGASILETTSDGRTALEICRRLTRPKDYNENVERGKESNKDKLCIDLLERQMEQWVPWEAMTDNLYMLDYLESRVRMARMLFPYEAKIAMEIAGAEWTPLYKGLPATVKDVGSNETSSMSAETLQKKLLALRKTVEIGQRYFPNCSEEIVKFIDDMPDAFYLEKGSEEEQNLKKTRFMELRDDVQKAFHKDMNTLSASSLPASASSGFSSTTTIITRSTTSSSSPRDRRVGSKRIRT